MNDIDNPKNQNYYEFSIDDLNLTVEELDQLKAFALDLLKKDEISLLTYAINTILQVNIKVLEGNIAALKKKILEKAKSSVNIDVPPQKRKRGRPKKEKI